MLTKERGWINEDGTASTPMIFSPVWSFKSSAAEMACSSATKTTALLLAFIVIFNLATCSSNNNNNNNNNNKKNKNIPRFVINPLTAQTTPATVASTTPTTRATAAKRQTNARMSSQVRDKTKKQEVQSGPSASALLSSATDFEEIAEMDPCFDHDSGEAVRCQPEFSDVAFNVSLRATSQCGSPSATVHCLSEIADDEYYNSSKQPIPFNFNGSRQQITTQIAASTPSLPPSLSSPPSSLQTTDSTTSKKRCFTCSRDHPDTSYPSSHLTDLHNPLDPTCWVSTPRVKTVNLTLNLGKRHELTYVTVEFCTGSRQPDAAIFWKSVDHGQSWIPIKYFSTDCQALLTNPGAFLVSPAFMRHHHRRDGRHRYHHGRTHRYRGGKMSKAKIPKSTTIATATEANITSMAIGFQPTCSGILEIKGQPLKLAFRASEGHNEAESLDPDVNLSLREWITFSDLRLTLYHGQQKSGSDLSRSNAGHEFFAVSNFNVGARCKCNGHASQCIPTDVVDDNDDHDEDEDGSRSDDDDRKTGIDHVTKKYEKLKCACRHNTMGSECEQCKPLYNDRPWTRATSKEAQECTECNCHGHARSCRFNEQLYKASKEYKSGGVCVRCRHNTAGRFCHLCTDGYFRTPGKSMTDKKACSPCSCHPIGSSSGMCNRTTGQCPCKRGVGGRTCDRCTEGFQQGNSPVKPCVQLRKSPGTVSDKSNLCRVYCKRSWSLTNDFAKQVCRENYSNHNNSCLSRTMAVVMQMKVISKKFKVLYNNRKPLKSRTWIRYGVEILNVFRKKTNLQSQELNPKQPGAARRFKQYKKDKPQKLSRNSHGGAQLVLPGSKMAAWTRVEDAKDCSCINLKTGFVYLVALPVSRQSRSWQEAGTRRQQTTHKIRISMPKFRIAGHRDDSDSFENDVRRNSRQQMVIEWNPQSNEKTSKQDKNISKYANDTIRNASFKTRSKREGRSTTQKPNQNSQNKPTLKVISTPKIALARPIEEIFSKRKQGVLKGKANGFSPFYDLPKKTKEKKSKMERKNVRMSRRSRMRLASDSLVLAWNTKETRDLFNKLDCF